MLVGIVGIGIREKEALLSSKRYGRRVDRDDYRTGLSGREACGKAGHLRIRRRALHDDTRNGQGCRPGVRNVGRRHERLPLDDGPSLNVVLN